MSACRLCNHYPCPACHGMLNDRIDALKAENERLKERAVTAEKVDVDLLISWLDACEMGPYDGVPYCLRPATYYGPRARKFCDEHKTEGSQELAHAPQLRALLKKREEMS